MFLEPFFVYGEGFSKDTLNFWEGPSRSFYLLKPPRRPVPSGALRRESRKLFRMLGGALSYVPALMFLEPKILKKKKDKQIHESAEYRAGICN